MPAVIALIAFFTGFYAIASQSYLVREFLVVFSGNEMSLAVLFAGWLGGVAAGARLARARALATFEPVYVAAVLLAWWVVAFLPAVTAVRLSRLLFAEEPGSLVPLSKIVLASAAFAAPFAAFSGLVFVTAAGLAERFARGARAVGTVYVAEAAGAVTGGLAFTFLMAGRVSPFSFGLAAYAAPAVLAAALAWASARGGSLSRRSAATLSIGMGFFLAAGVGLAAAGRGAVLEENTAVARMQSIGRGMTVASRESRYENLTVVMLSGQYTVYGNGEPVLTFPEPLLNERDAYLALAEEGDAKKVLVAGGGPDFLSAVLSYGVESADYVELDPALVEAVRPFLGEESRRALDSPKVRVHYGDAREFIERAAAAGARYDVIFVRAAEPRTLLANRLYTREFMLAARSCLAEGGVFALPVTLADGYLYGEVGRYAGDVYRTMKGVFPQILVTPDTSALFLAGAKSGVLTADPEELSRRFFERGLRSQLFPELFAAIFPPERTIATNDALKNYPASVNTDWRPTTYLANLVLWARYSGSRVAAWYMREIGVRWYHACLLALVLGTLAMLPAAVLGRPSTSAATAILFTGASAMSMTMIVIYAFQVECGYVYAWIGVLAGAFAAGLAAGGAAGTAAAAPAEKAGRRLVAADAGAFAAPLVALATLLAVSRMGNPEAARWIIAALAAVMGFATGFEFPVAAAVVSARGAEAKRAASKLQAADQAGALAGALVTGLVIVPAIGIFWSLVLLAGLKVMSLACVAVTARR